MTDPISDKTEALAETAFEAYRKKLGELNAGKAMTGSPMPSWGEVAAKRPDEPGGHVAACWRATAEAIQVINAAISPRTVDVDAIAHDKAQTDAFVLERGNGVMIVEGEPHALVLREVGPEAHAALQGWAARGIALGVAPGTMVYAAGEVSCWAVGREDLREPPSEPEQ